MKRVLTDRLFGILISNLRKYPIVELFLKDLNISNLEEFYKTFLSKNFYKKPDFDKNKFPSLSDFWDIVEANYSLAFKLWEMRIISEKDLIKQRRLSVYHPTFNKEIRKKLHRRKYFTVGDLCDNFLNPDGSFKERKRGDAFRTGIRHRIATVLKNNNFLSQEEFDKVPKLQPKLSIPTDEQIGEDGNILLHTLKWSHSTKGVIEISIRRIFDDLWWSNMKLSHLVKRFVRIDRQEKTHFNIKGHLGSVWYGYYTANGTFEIALLEIRKKLEELNFLEEELIEETGSI